MSRDFSQPIRSGWEADRPTNPQTPDSLYNMLCQISKYPFQCKIWSKVFLEFLGIFWFWWLDWSVHDPEKKILMLPKLAKIVFGGLLSALRMSFFPILLKRGHGSSGWLRTFAHYSVIFYSILLIFRYVSRIRLIILSPRNQERHIRFIRGHIGDGRLPDKLRCWFFVCNFIWA